VRLIAGMQWSEDHWETFVETLSTVERLSGPSSRPTQDASLLSSKRMQGPA
jgi:hypothetical protein